MSINDFTTTTIAESDPIRSFFVARLGSISQTIDRHAHRVYGHHGQHFVDDLVSAAYEKLWKYYCLRPDVPLRTVGEGYWVVFAKYAMSESLKPWREKFHAEVVGPNDERDIEDALSHIDWQGRAAESTHQIDERLDMDAAIEKAASMVSDWDRPRMLKLIELLREGLDMKEAAPMLDMTYDQARKLMRVIRKVMKAALAGEQIECKRQPHGRPEVFGRSAAAVRLAAERDPIAARLYAQGRSYRDIADHFGVHETTARKMVQRGQQK